MGMLWCKASHLGVQCVCSMALCSPPQAVICQMLIHSLPLPSLSCASEVGPESEREPSSSILCGKQGLQAWQKWGSDNSSIWIWGEVRAEQARHEDSVQLPRWLYVLLWAGTSPAQYWLITVIVMQFCVCGMCIPSAQIWGCSGHAAAGFGLSKQFNFEMQIMWFNGVRLGAKQQSERPAWANKFICSE